VQLHQHRSGIPEPVPAVGPAEGEEAAAGAEEGSRLFQAVAVGGPVGGCLVIAQGRLLQGSGGLGEGGMGSEHAVLVAGHAVVRLRGECPRGGALANGHADAHQVDDVLTQVPAASPPRSPTARCTSSTNSRAATRSPARAWIQSAAARWRRERLVLGICLRPLPTGWSVGPVTVNDGRSVIALNHDRAGAGAVVIELTATCDIQGAGQVSSNQSEVRRYQRIDRQTPRFEAVHLDQFPGGCVTTQATVPAANRAEVTSNLAAILSYTTRQELQQALDQRSGGRLQLDPPTGGRS
jgi:hypothetical protein